METSQDIEFRWGRKEGVSCKSLERQYYGSFSYDGVEYFLYDSVYFWGEGQPSPHIGKLIEIYETSKFEKMVKIVWYFHPSEVQRWLRGSHVLKNELFLGSGAGRGLVNVNVLETISGKCNVVCTSKDERNPKASLEDLKMSEYVFSRTFDVKECKISERFPDKIAGINVEHFFNPKRKGNFKVTAVKDEDSVSGKFTNNFVTKVSPANFGRLTSSSSTSDSSHLKKRKLLEFDAGNGKHIEADSQSVEQKKRLKVDSSEWFKKLPWEERMQKAHETGSLVLLDNLYSSFTSLELEGIVMDAFNVKASAKMMQHTAFSSPKIGKALVIFNSKDEADFVISELNTKCLVIGLRPVVGSRPSLKEPGNHPSKYFGHIMLNTTKLKQRIEKNAVSTSHFSQPNTVSFDMAMEWKAQQKKWELCWDAIYMQQAKEIANLQDHLKAKKR